MVSAKAHRLKPVVLTLCMENKKAPYRYMELLESAMLMRNGKNWMISAFVGIHAFTQFFASTEIGDGFGRNFDGFASLGIATSTGVAVV